MHPAPSIILFTTLSGAGFGMLAFLGFTADPPTGWVAFVFFAIAFALAGGGLAASAFHLGHPERALKAFREWRSSWLSREAWAAAMTLAVAGLYGAVLVFFESDWDVLGIATGALALVTVFSTSMIYMQMQSVPRWNHWSPPVLFLAYSVTGGALLTGDVSLATWLLPLTGIVQVAAWVSQDMREDRSQTTIATATGLGGMGRVRAFEPPHTGDNYLTKEMVFRIGRKHARALRVISVVLSSALPLVLLMLPFQHALAAAAGPVPPCRGNGSALVVLCRGPSRRRILLWTLTHGGYS